MEVFCKQRRSVGAKIVECDRVDVAQHVGRDLAAHQQDGINDDSKDDSVFRFSPHKWKKPRHRSPPRLIQYLVDDPTRVIDVLIHERWVH